MKKRIGDLTLEDVARFCHKKKICENCSLDNPNADICIRNLIYRRDEEIEVEVNETYL